MFDFSIHNYSLIRFIRLSFSNTSGSSQKLWKKNKLITQIKMIQNVLNLYTWTIKMLTLYSRTMILLWCITSYYIISFHCPCNNWWNLTFLLPQGTLPRNRPNAPLPQACHVLWPSWPRSFGKWVSHGESGYLSDTCVTPRDGWGGPMWINVFFN